jgi:hypothetical protein
MRIKFFKREVIKFGWEATKKNLIFFIGLTLFFFIGFILSIRIIYYFIYDILSFRYILPPLSEIIIFPTIIFPIAFWIIFPIILMGFLKIALKCCDNKKLVFFDLFSGFRSSYFNFLIGSIPYVFYIFYVIFSIIIPKAVEAIIFYILLFLAIQIIVIRFIFFGYFIVDQNLGLVESYKKSFTITKGKELDLFFIICINLMGLIPYSIFTLDLIPVKFIYLDLFLNLFLLAVPFITTFPTTLIALACIYRELLAQTESTNVNITKNQEQINSEQS